ncbi:unnamed protein product [Orchesella dallaii]|uniref:Odorant receptor n=1 Tax=Orchesella dallaii TaxID=48710 RepID=A0ABP1PYY9_9HEXA
MQIVGTLKERARCPRFEVIKLTGFKHTNHVATVALTDMEGTQIYGESKRFKTPKLHLTKTRSDKTDMKIIKDNSRTCADHVNSTRIAENFAIPMLIESKKALGESAVELDPEASKSKDNSSNPENHNRPYLLSDATFRRLRIIIFLGMLCANIPWRWDNKTKRIYRWSPVMVKLWKLYWFISVIQSICMFLYHMQCLMGMYSRNLESYREIFAYSTVLYWYTCHLGYRTCMILYEDDMRKYINRIQDFNEKYVDKYLINADKGIEFGLCRMVMKLAIPAAASQIANSLFMFLIKPSAPYYLTSNIQPLRWYSLIPGALQDLTVTGHTIGTYLILSWMQVAHTSSMEFWLQEMHKGIDSNYTKEELRHPKAVVQSYKAMQLMCRMYNDYMGPLCIPVWKFSVAFGFIPCGYLWIRSMNQIFIEEFPDWGEKVLESSFILLSFYDRRCLQMAAQLYDIANSFIKSWSNTKEKHFKRVLMSCPTLKVKVGKYYHITAATTITFFQFMIGYVINCIITFP